MPIQLNSELAARIAARLPEGRSVECVRIVTARGEIVSTPTALSEREQALIASQVETAGGPPKLTNGVPTIIRIAAWLAHEGVNNNRLSFVADELGPAADRIREPNFLLMDFNHSAVLPFSFEQKAIGVWYSAEKRWDPKAKDGAGAYGILAEGIMWAWAFPDYADTMLAEQARAGSLAFSMACVPETLEVGHDASGTFEIAHNPVFLTLSALDVKPADRDALGLGVEGSTDPELEAKLKQKLTNGIAGTDTRNTPAPLAAALDVALTEDEMDELQNQINELKAQLNTANEKLGTLTAAEQQVGTLTARITELETKLADAQGQLTEANTAKDALVAQANELKQAADTMNEELSAAKTKLAEIAAKEEEASKAERYASRLETLPKTYVAALEKRAPEEQEKFKAKWTNASDADWTEFQAEIAATFKELKISYLDRSNNEGGLLPMGEGSKELAEELASIKR